MGVAGLEKLKANSALMLNKIPESESLSIVFIGVSVRYD